MPEDDTSNGNVSKDAIPPDPTPAIPQRSANATASLPSNVSESQLPSIKEEDKGTPTTPSGNEYQLQVGAAKRRTVSDLTPDQKTPIGIFLIRFKYGLIFRRSNWADLGKQHN
jgi:hypothetical protein